MGDRHLFVDDGIVTEEEAKGKRFFDRWLWLPGGSVYLEPYNGPKDRVGYFSIGLNNSSLAKTLRRKELFLRKL